MVRSPKGRQALTMTMLQIMDTVRDRGSRYAVSGGAVADAAAVRAYQAERSP